MQVEGVRAMVSERYRKGLTEMRRHLGTPEADEYIAKINEVSAEFAKLNVEFPFGELYRRDILDDKTRELCAVTALTVLGHALPELRVHVKAALNCGASREEIVEVVTQMIAYCGFPAATNALLTVKETFELIDAEPTDD